MYIYYIQYAYTDNIHFNSFFHIQSERQKGKTVEKGHLFDHI